MTLEQIFKLGRIVALAGNRNSGKTNNLIYLIEQFRKHNSKTPIYLYGFPPEVMLYLKNFNVKEIDSMRQLTSKRDCILIIDEMQRLKLNDRRYSEIKTEFSDYIYHNNVYCLLSSPNIREFNSVIGSIIEGWVLKSVDVADCVNGSPLKQAVDEYKGEYKTLGCIDMPKSHMLLINDQETKTIVCGYVAVADTKRLHKDLFVSEISQKNVSELSDVQLERLELEVQHE